MNDKAENKKKKGAGIFLDPIPRGQLDAKSKGGALRRWRVFALKLGLNLCHSMSLHAMPCHARAFATAGPARL